MKAKYYLSIFVCGWLTNTALAVECQPDWSVYKDETCFRAYNELLTYDDATALCASKSSSSQTASLVMVKDAGMQEFLANFTKEFYEHMWLGGKYDAALAEFKWADGDSLTYTNWADGYPRNNTETEPCIQLQPVNSRSSTKASDGKWEDASCQRRNLVICQRAAMWTLEDATKEILRLRKRDSELLKQLEEVNQRVVPVGSVYVEHYNQPSPRTLWPTLQWEDITASYAGMFFRALGGNAANWGENQSSCSPKISQMSYDEQPLASEFEWSVPLPENGWSRYLHVGSMFGGGYQTVERLRLHVTDCEVRPTNQAVRIWRRSA